MITGNSGSVGRMPSFLDDWPSLIDQFARPYQVAKKEATNTGFLSVDIVELSEAFQLLIDAPGVQKDEIEISVEDRALTLRFERRAAELAENAQFLKRTRQVGKFEKSFSLPDSIDEEGITASLKDGVLLIEVPKKPEVKPKTIQIK